MALHAFLDAIAARKARELKPEYRFKCQIIDETTGQVIEVDWTSLTEIDRIDEFGNCEAVDSIVGKMLRNWRGFAHADYERENYALAEAEIEPDGVMADAARMRRARDRGGAVMTPQRDETPVQGDKTPASDPLPSVGPTLAAVFLVDVVLLTVIVIIAHWLFG